MHVVEGADGFGIEVVIGPFRARPSTEAPVRDVEATPEEQWKRVLDEQRVDRRRQIDVGEGLMSSSSLHPAAARARTPRTRRLTRRRGRACRVIVGEPVVRQQLTVVVRPWSPRRRETRSCGTGMRLGGIGGRHRALSARRSAANARAAASAALGTGVGTRVGAARSVGSTLHARAGRAAPRSTTRSGISTVTPNSPIRTVRFAMVSSSFRHGHARITARQRPAGLSRSPRVYVVNTSTSANPASRTICTSVLSAGIHQVTSSQPPMTG